MVSIDPGKFGLETIRPWQHSYGGFLRLEPVNSAARTAAI